MPAGGQGRLPVCLAAEPGGCMRLLVAHSWLGLGTHVPVCVYPGKPVVPACWRKGLCSYLLGGPKCSFGFFRKMALVALSCL